jgi:hypothetical protein
MSQPIDEKRRTLFLDPRLGWTEQETPDARLRLQSLWRSQSSVYVENKLQALYDRGGWNDVGPSQLPTLGGQEQGLVFTTKPRQGDTQAFVEVTCVRFVDEHMQEMLLDGLTLYDTDLRPLSAAKMAADRFCLPSTQIETFTARVRARNGQLSEGTADLQAMYHKAAVRMPQIVQELERLCEMSRAVIDQVAEGRVQTEVPSISERCRSTHQLREQAAAIVTELRDEHMTLERNVGQVEFQGHAAAYVAHAEEWMQRVEQLHREHTSYEVQARMRIQESLSQTLQGAESPATTRRYLLMPVVEYYTEMGYDCRLTNDGMKIVIGETTVELSERPTVRSPDQQSAAEQMTGRQTAERGQRQL